MVFSSVSFLFYFLPLVLAIYYLAKPSWRNSIFMLAGLFFYLWGAGEVVFILIFSSLTDWLFGLLAAKTLNSPRRWLKLLPLVGSVVINLGILGFFKYTNFFIDQINIMGGSIFSEFEPIFISKILLPIGVSFFTFQSMSYVFDVSRGRVQPLKNPVDFTMYICMFPQLVAGPIVRFHEIAPQITDRSVTWDHFCAGSIRFILGLVKKVVFADSIAMLADQIFAIKTGLPFGLAWLGVLAFTIQVYFDFSGYSDMAIGLGTLFGFRLPENFNRPYLAVSITDFWRRWHITLTNWFRDYIYIPLGGSRTTQGKIYFNLFFVFILVGFWHGADWTYILFGLYHGFWLSLERATGYRDIPPRRHIILRRAGTFFILMVGMVLFRAESLSHAWQYYLSLFALQAGSASLLVEAFTAQSVILLIIGTVIVFRPGDRPLGIMLDQSETRGAALIRMGLATIALTVTVLMIVSSNFKPFVYFQF